MRFEIDLGKAALAPAAILGAVFAPQTLLYAAGMYVAGSVSGAYMEAATANAANRIRREYEDGDEAADLLEGAGHLGNSFVRTASMFLPVVPLVAAAAGRHLNSETFKKPKINSKRSKMDLKM